LLQEGQILLKSQQYDELIAKYKEAKTLFLQIKWNGEAKKVEDSIKDFAKQKQLILQKQENERKLRKEKKIEWETKERELSQEKEIDPQVDEEKRKKIQQSQSRKQTENEVYAKLDEAAAHEKS